MKNLILLAMMSLVFAACGSKDDSKKSNPAIVDCAEGFMGSYNHVDYLFSNAKKLAEQKASTEEQGKARRKAVNACLKHFSKYGTAQCLKDDGNGNKSVQPPDTNAMPEAKARCEQYDRELKERGY